MNGEKWKKVNFDVDFLTDGHFEVSNFGRVRSFNKISDGNILKGSVTNGYNVIRYKLYIPREEKVQEKFNAAERKITKLIKLNKAQIEAKENKKIIQETQTTIAQLKKNLSKAYFNDTKSRLLHKHFLVHRMVATVFLPKPKPMQTLVAHLDFDKENNRASNLQWMSVEENKLHQLKSPFVLQDKKERKERCRDNKNIATLSTTKVMLLKKMLNNNKPVKQLTKQFKITPTQVYRIKRGENWGNVPAAN